MSKDIKVGDVVKLKSGGPTMTVETITYRSEFLVAEVVWFDASDEEKSGRFLITSLNKEE